MGRKSICSIDGCGNFANTRGLCKRHFTRWQRGLPMDLILKRSFRSIRAEMDAAVASESDECVIWTGPRNNYGYAQGARIYGTIAVHRQVCIEVNGDPPTSKHEAAHTCGNGNLGCINPRHLIWKTHADNMADMTVHGTSQRGEVNFNAKIRETDIPNIRLLLEHKSQNEIAKLYGVHPSSISRIASKLRWKHVTT